MHELADVLTLSRSALTRFIDRVEKAGLVVRESSSEDRRGTFVALTDQGRKVFEEAAPLHLTALDRHFAKHLTDDEARVIRDALGRIAVATYRGSDVALLREPAAKTV